MRPHEALASLGLALPPAPKPVGSYVPAVRVGELVFVSGQLPMREGKLVCAGRVPSEVSVEQAAEAARIAALNGLAIAADVAGGLDRIAQVVRLAVYVQSDEGFPDQPKVANGASDLMAAVFGDAGRHARAAVGCNALPLNSPVEVELITRVTVPT
jgi:enamine deaminase RidA (YjgF/YER057c/UK114 family)